MSYKIIAADLDGTLFTDDKTILPETMEALKKAAAMGIHIIPSTGRPLAGVSETVLGMGITDYVLTCNGAAVYDVKNGSLLFETPIPWEKAADIIDSLDGLHLSLDAFIGKDAYKDRLKPDIIDSLAVSEHIKNYIRSTRIYVDDLPAYIRTEKKNVHKFTLNFCRDGGDGYIDRKETLAVLSDIGGITVVSGGEGNLEITSLGVSKGTALLKTGELLNVPREEIIAFGDSGNDIDMITAAGTGVAMENGADEVRAAADFVTRSNNENGIAYALEKFIFL